MALMKTEARAPGRCGILGNPSDIYGGKVLSCSVPAHAVCILEESEDWILPEDLRLWSATQVRFPIDTPLKVTWSTDIPRSSGLSGSTALLAATLAAVIAYRGEGPALATPKERTAFAELARDIERFDAGVMCGYQDAYMIVHGHMQLMDFAGKHPGQKGPEAVVKRIEAPVPFLLITTGVERLSGSVHAPLAERWMNGEPLIRDSIAEISTFAEPGAEWLVEGDYGRLGQTMDRNQFLVAKMGGSGDAVDKLILDCKQSGAIGAKLAGAGMGGTIIALTEEPDRLEKDLRLLGYTRFMRPLPVDGVSMV